MKKNLATFLILLGVGSIAHADCTPRDLEFVMKDMGRTLKKLDAVSVTSEPSTDSADLAKNLRGFILEAIALSPDNVSAEKDATKQKTLSLDYITLLSDELQTSISLEKAFLAGDSAAVTSLIAHLKDVKQKGHDEFKPAE